MEKYLRNKKVKMRFKEDIEPQEVLLDSLAQKREEEFGISEKKLKFHSQKRSSKLFILFF